MSTARPMIGEWRTALWSVRLMFFLTGLLFATWAARTPTIKEQFHLDEAGLAIAFAGLNIGAVLGLQLGKVVTLRFGSRATLRVTMPLFAVTLSGLLVARDLAVLTVAVAVFAIANSVVDVAMNAHGVAVEKVSAQPLLSGIHACHSLGMIAGGLAGAVAERAHVALTAHFVAVTVVVAAVAGIGARRLLPSSTDRSTPDEHATRRSPWRWPTRLIALGLLAFCVALAEGAANEWTAVYIHDVTGASTSVAAIGFAVFAGSMFVGRLLGDRLVTAFGPARPYLIATLTAAIGMGIALLIGGTVPALIGGALFGLGISFTLPVTFAAAGSVAEMSPAQAIANISMLGYLGFFTGPVLIGATAQNYGLAIALAIPVFFMALAACGTPALRRSADKVVMV
ncbi:MFS transporter [Nocardia sp. NPDC051052]|uniref:MFS transporter n=1 Tax=Nocardia sp. NPDC051052 TaxID=3364322 RepID=UPI0037AB7CA1